MILPTMRQIRIQRRERRTRNKRITATEGYKPYFAWLPVKASLSTGTQYYDDERIVWLSKVERRLVEDTIYPGYFNWQYHIIGYEHGKEQL